jgi:hypothetical protein
LHIFVPGTVARLLLIRKNRTSIIAGNKGSVLD